MQLSLLKSTPLGDTQTAFHTAFPWLKLAFFSRSHEKNHNSNAKFMITDTHLTLSEVSGFTGEAILAIEGNMPAWEVEKLIETATGLHVQIFRKSGPVWLETGITDEMTLDQQSARAQEQEQLSQVTEEIIDYREQP